MTVLRALPNAERNPLLLALLTIVLSETRKPMLNIYVTVVEALQEAQRVKQYGTGGVAERAGVAKRKRKCIAYVFCRVAPTKKKYSSVVYAHTYIRSQQRELPNEREIASRTIRDYLLCPAGNYNRDISTRGMLRRTPTS